MKPNRKYYTLRNREGRTIELRGNITMQEMIKMGFTEFRLVTPETPIPPDVWRADTHPGEARLLALRGGDVFANCPGFLRRTTCGAVYVH